jgi:selenide,water dikinase
MVFKSGRSVRLFSKEVPVIPEALDFAAMGLIPAGAYKNREFRESMVLFDKTVNRTLQDVLFDPQTSGGLLMSVKASQAASLVAALKEAGIEEAAEIGEVMDGPEEKIRVE